MTDNPRSIQYDKKDPDSILRYAKELEGHTLREKVTDRDKENVAPANRKGAFGQTLERGYFLLDNNSDARPDFYDTGIELKTTPMKRSRGRYASKERLALNVINYMELPNSTFEDSFLSKNEKLLIIFYLFKEGLSIYDYKILKALLWKFPKEDMMIIRDDWNKIVEVVKNGRAEELSERHTMYLGASPKGAGHNNNLRKQPFSDKQVPQRAFSLKQSYVNKIYRHTGAESLIKDLTKWPEHKSFEEIILERFEPFIGISCEDIERKLGVELNNRSKGYYADMARKMMGVEGKRIEEFDNAGIKMKTIRIHKNGTPKEDMSFPCFDYLQLIGTDWEGSDIYRQLDKRFLFVIFKIDGEKVYFEKSMFWAISENDLLEVKRVWEETVRRVKVGCKDLPQSAENRVAFVRTHGRNSEDMIPLPNGTMDVRRSFWLNRRFIKEQIGDQQSS